MAEIIKISELPSQTVFADDDLFATVDTSVAETKKAQLSNIKTYMQGDLNTRLTTAEGEIDTAQTDINNAESVIGNETDTYSTSSTYDLGSLVIYNSLLYKCTTAITVAEAWNASKWTQVSLVDVSSGLKGKILWKNPNPISAFVAQTISLSSDDYDSFAIIYVGIANSSTYRFYKNTGILPYLSNNGYILESEKYSRYYKTLSKLSFQFNNNAETNFNCVPIYIIGYKTGLFS